MRAIVRGSKQLAPIFKSFYNRGLGADLDNSHNRNKETA